MGFPETSLKNYHNALRIIPQESRSKNYIVPVHGLQAYGGRTVAVIILNCGTSWRWVVDLTSRPLCPWEITPATNEYMARWTMEPLLSKWSRNKFLAPAGIRIPNSPVLILVTVMTKLRCHYLNNNFISKLKFLKWDWKTQTKNLYTSPHTCNTFRLSSHF